MIRAAVASVLAILIAVTAIAAAPQAPAFEVASLRLSDPSAPRNPFSQRITATRVDIENISLLSVIRTAFRLRDRQLIALPGLEEMRVHIHATIPAGVTRDQVPDMLQRLLADRLGLVVHRESRPVDGHELVVDAGGVKMREATPVNELTGAFKDPLLAAPQSDITAETLHGQVRTIISPSYGVRTVTERSLYDRKMTERLTVMIAATRITMPELASLLEGTINEPVIDKTGLTGVYQFRLELPHDAGVVQQLLAQGRTTTPGGAPLSVPTSWSKVVEPLGLRLEKRRVPLEFVVIDRINRTPIEN